MSQAGRVEAYLRTSHVLMEAMARARDLALPDWLIFSGAIYQTVWNGLTGRATDYGLKDYDLGYFDPDTSWDAEDAVIVRVRQSLPPPLADQVEVRNQARVHLWFEGKFGEPYEALPNTGAALERFVSPAFSIGARLEGDGRLTIVAPFGFDDLLAMRVRPNPLRPLALGFDRAAASARARWPEVEIMR